MGNLRFLLAGVALFAGTFVAVSGGVRIFPAMWSQPAGPQQIAAIDTTVKSETEPAPEAATPVAVPQPAASSHPEPEPASPARATPPAEPPPPVRSAASPDQLAITTIQAADAYAKAPCDVAARAAFMVAASTYLRAKAENEAGAPADQRARHAIKVAVAAGRIGRDQFPSGTDVPEASMPRSRLSCVSSAGLRP